VNKIGWCYDTFSPWRGCQKVSPACQHCYAEAMSKRFDGDIWGPSAPRLFQNDEYWKKPIRWNAAARRAGKRLRIFCASMADVFENRTDLVAPRARLFGLIEATPSLDWLLLTKRPENIERLSPKLGQPNVWLGTSAENQKYWDERMPILMAIPAIVHFVSAEPLLSPITMNELGLYPEWLICGGESGPKARPMEREWAESFRDQCQANNVAFFMKQMAKKAPIPAELLVRQWPAKPISC